MLLELFIVLQIASFVLFAAGFISGDERFWAFSAVLAGILAFAAYDIVQNATIVSSQEIYTNSSDLHIIYYEYGTQAVAERSLILSWINVGVSMVSVVFFLYEIFDQRTKK